MQSTLAVLSQLPTRRSFATSLPALAKKAKMPPKGKNAVPEKKSVRGELPLQRSRDDG
jgi:hypothetical protein